MLQERLAVRVSELVSVTENVSDNNGAKLLQAQMLKPCSNSDPDEEHRIRNLH
jgi:hypothetical protein